MVPGHYMQLVELPLNSNGKVDRKRLPEVQGLVLNSNEEYVAARNEIEEKLVLIWQELLGKERIGVTDNFFELGGHSLKATRLTSQIHKVFDVNISLFKLFDRPTIENLANEIEKTNLVNTEVLELEDAENISI
jgi:acyl carrier protein